MKSFRKSNFAIFKIICLRALKEENVFSINEMAKRIKSSWKTTRDTINILVWIGIFAELPRVGITRQFKLTKNGKSNIFLRSLQESKKRFD